MKLRNFSFIVLPIVGLIFASCSSNPVVPGPSSQQAMTQTQVVVQPLAVTIISPDFSQPLKSPVTIHGKVSGLFFFEGTFPVVLLDAKGKEIATAVAHADEEWMTEAQVPFTIKLVFKVASKTAATLVFKKDNPSGLPVNDFSQSFAVTLQ